MPSVGSLFSGIGGLDLGLERAGWDVRWQVECDPFCLRVLEKHWPNVRRYTDVHEPFPRDYTEHVDLICGGFPCQPVSVAGKRLAQADIRWLWPEFARVVRALRPRLVLLENVPGLLVRGVGDVLSDLAACGYDAEWDCIPASAVGAPHRRDRVWIVAYPAIAGLEGWRGPEAARTAFPIVGREDQSSVADADESGWGTRRARGSSGMGARLREQALSDSTTMLGREIVRDESDGVLPDLGDANGARQLQPEGIFSEQRGRPSDSGWWSSEPDVGRVAHGVPARVDRLRGLGNAVVPQVAEWIGRRLIQCL